MNYQSQMEEYIGLTSSLFFITEQYKKLDELNDFELMNEYLNDAIQMGSVEAIFYKGNIYDEKQDYSKMIEYYEKGAEKEDINCVFNLGYYYKERKDYENMKKWFLKGSELKDPDCMCEMGKYYELLEKDDEKYNEEYDNKDLYIKKYYLMAVELHYLRAYYLLGQWYSKIDEPDDMAYFFIKGIDDYNYNRHLKHIQNKNIDLGENYNENLVVKMMEKTAIYFDDEMHDYNNSIKYYLMAVEKNSVNAMYNLGRIYYEQGIYDKMMSYLLMGVNCEDIDCMYELSIYYQDKNDFENMKKYYLMALEVKCPIPSKSSKTININDGEKDFNLFKVKDILETIENPSINIMKKLNKIKSKKEIMIYENKKNLFSQLNHVIECGICYDIRLNIDLNCGHCVCTECYSRLYNKACPFCRF